jgi:hypothetical protein
MKKMKYYLAKKDYDDFVCEVDLLFKCYSKLLNQKTMNKLHFITGL